MNVVHWVVIGAIVILALLVARGVYLIGRGSEVEYEARTKAADSDVANTGWLFLDQLRFGDLPIISSIEEWLGRSTAGDRARCLDCRHSWISGQQTAQPVCPNCGRDNTRVVGGES